MRVIAIANFKGGVGKSTSTENLAAALAEQGRNILAIDIDPQSSLTTWFGHHVKEGDATIYQVLMGEAPIAQAARRLRDHLDLVPATPDLFGASMALAGMIGREKYLTSVLATLNGEYDYCLIDCPPGLDLLTANALTAAQAAIVPVQCAFPAVQGLKLFMDNVAMIRKMANPSLEIAGILMTKFDSRTAHSNEVVAKVREGYGKLVFETTIPATVRFDEAPVTGKPILEYAPDSPGAAAYRRLAMEVMRRVEIPACQTAGNV